MTLNVDYGEPYDMNKQVDIDAVDRKVHFQLGWFANPIIFGVYPEVMVKLVGDRLPTFTTEQ